MKKIKLSENLELSQVVMGCMRIADSNLTENELLNLVEKCLDMGGGRFRHFASMSTESLRCFMNLWKNCRVL